MEIQHVGNAAGRPASAHPIDSTRAEGFSLIELMMTISVAVILMMIAVPSFQYVTNANRVSSEVNGLLGDLQFARAEAIKEGENVTVCASTDQLTCASSNDWQTGWIVFADSNPPAYVVPPGTTPLRIQTKFTSTDIFQATNDLTWVTFNRNGYAQGILPGTLIDLQTQPITNAWTRCLIISFTGVVTTVMQGTQGCT